MDDVGPRAMTDLEALRALEEAATPGPWRVFKTTDGKKLLGVGELDGGGLTDCGTEQGFGFWGDEAQRIANAALIVAMRNALPRLIAEITALRSAAERARDALRPFVSAARDFEIDLPDTLALGVSDSFSAPVTAANIGDLRAAATAHASLTAVLGEKT